MLANVGVDAEVLLINEGAPWVAGQEILRRCFCPKTPIY